LLSRHQRHQCGPPENSWNLCNEVMEYIKFRNENPIPGVMPILAGLGSPQEMKVHDEKWHTENFMWGNSRTRRKGFGPMKSPTNG
jgi:benzoyl-CoA reductase subunit BamB